MRNIKLDKFHEMSWLYGNIYIYKKKRSLEKKPIRFAKFLIYGMEKKNLFFAKAINIGVKYHNIINSLIFCFIKI